MAKRFENRPDTQLVEELRIECLATRYRQRALATSYTAKSAQQLSRHYAFNDRLTTELTSRDTDFAPLLPAVKIWRAALLARFEKRHNALTQLAEAEIQLDGLLGQ